MKVKIGNDEDVAGSTSQGSETNRRSPYTMTEEILQKRLEHENRGRYITQFCAALAASMAALSFGTVLGWSSPSVRHLMGPVNNTRYNLTKENYAWVASLMPLGCSVGILPWSYTVNKIGPQRTLLILAPLYIVTFIITLTVKKFSMYLALRFFSGFLSIANMIGGECLLLDTVHRGNLPHMIVFFRSSVWLGVLLSYIIGHFMTKRVLLIVCGILPTVNTMLLLFLPESPVFLYDQNEPKAEKALSWYRGHANIYTEMRNIKKDSEMRKIGMENYRYMFFAKPVIKGCLIVLGLTFFQVFSGYYAFVFYTSVLWNESEDLFDPFIDAITFGVCLYISNFISGMIHYHIPFGVRKPLLISTSLTATMLTIISIYLFLHENNIFFHSENIHWIPLTTLNGFVISYEIGLSTYPDILLFEYLPYQVQVRAKSIIQVCFWFLVFLLTKYFMTVHNVTRNFIPFGILAVITHIGTIFCYFFIIETKGKNLIQIQIEIGGNPIGNRGAYRNRIGPSTVPRFT